MDLRLQSRIDSYRKSQYYSKDNSFNSKIGLHGLEKAGKYRNDSITIDNRSSKIGSKKITNSILDVINFDTASLTQYVDENRYSVDGMEFSGSQIPEIPLSRLNDIKAVDNVITIENGKYYKYTDSSGDIHKISCRNNQMSTVYSENLIGEPDYESFRCGHFWSILAENGTFIGLQYSDEEEKQYLNAAGITEGFFTVNVGNKSQEYFYSNGNSGRSVLKSIYDTDYNVIKNEGRFFSDYEPGTIIKVDGKEYELSESHTLDIPYGADIFNIEYPPINRN